MFAGSHRIILFILASVVVACLAGSKSSPHPHQGVLKAFTGEPIAYSVSDGDSAKLEKGEAVLVSQRSGQSGRGLALQDVHAPPAVCMEQIKNLQNYPNVVPKLKKVEIYDTKTFGNGTEKYNAEFTVGALFVKVNYFLSLTYEPSHNTFTWTLDYKYNSDLDDSVGQWQVMPHPSKEGWTRILYSTEVKLFSWVPEMIVNLMTKSALVESTAWVKKESEKKARKEEL